MLSTPDRPLARAVEVEAGAQTGRAPQVLPLRHRRRAHAFGQAALYPPSQEETGPLLETLVLHELSAFIAYRRLGYPLHFWRSYDGTEVYFLCETATGFVAVEVKAAAHWCCMGDVLC